MLKKIIPFIYILSACTHTQNKDLSEKSIEKQKSPPTQSLTNADSCEGKVQRFASKLPLYMPKEKVFVTKITKDCKEKSDTFLTVMGIPCQGADGHLSTKGYLSRPKMVSFSLDVGCKSSSSSKQEIEEQLKSHIQLPNLRVLAINPLEIKYWEIPSIKEIGMGENIELRTNKSLEVFKSMRQGDSLGVVFYGRENSWGRSQNIYKVKATIGLPNPNKKKFSLSVQEGSPLNISEIDKVKNRCQLNRYKIPCLLGLMEQSTPLPNIY